MKQTWNFGCLTKHPFQVTPHGGARRPTSQILHVERSSKMHDLRVDMGHMLRFTDVGFVDVYVLPLEKEGWWNHCIIIYALALVFFPREVIFFQQRWGWIKKVVTTSEGCQLAPKFWQAFPITPTRRVLVSLDGNSQFVLCTLWNVNAVSWVKNKHSSRQTMLEKWTIMKTYVL